MVNYIHVIQYKPSGLVYCVQESNQSNVPVEVSSLDELVNVSDNTTYMSVYSLIASITKKNECDIGDIDKTEAQCRLILEYLCEIVTNYKHIIICRNLIKEISYQYISDNSSVAILSDIPPF